MVMQLDVLVLGLRNFHMFKHMKIQELLVIKCRMKC